MHRTFYELSEEELANLREDYRWRHFGRMGILVHEEITNEMLEDDYGDIYFVDEDFYCNALKSVEEQRGKGK